MKASEVIAKLAALIAEHGDLDADVVIRESDGSSIRGVEAVHMSSITTGKKGMGKGRYFFALDCTL